MGGGTPSPHMHRLYPQGLSPAWVGEPYRWAISSPTPTVYPRVGGGTGRMPPLRLRLRGLSPRGRGNLEDRGATAIPSGSIPAWAGEPCPGSLLWLSGPVYPRVGGGTVITRPYWTVSSGLSPRGRGNHPPCTFLAQSGGSIPAWAGEPNSCGQAGGCWAVYPRVGGGTVARYCTS